METRETTKARDIRVKDIMLDDLVAVFKDWKNAHTKTIEDKHDYSELEYNQDGKIWKFTLDTRLGSNGHAWLSCEGGIKTQLAGITKVLLKDGSISFVSGERSYEISDEGFRHYIDFSSNPRATATVDIPRRTE